MKKEDQVRIYKRGKVGKFKVYTTSQEPLKEFMFKPVAIKDIIEKVDGTETTKETFRTYSELKQATPSQCKVAIGIPRSTPSGSRTTLMRRAIEALAPKLSEENQVNCYKRGRVDSIDATDKEFLTSRELKQATSSQCKVAIELPESAPSESRTTLMRTAIEALAPECSSSSQQLPKVEKFNYLVKTEDGQASKLPMFYPKGLNPSHLRYLLVTLNEKKVSFIKASSSQQLVSLRQAPLFEIQGITGFLKNYPSLMKSPLIALGIPEDLQGDVSQKLLNKLYPGYNKYLLNSGVTPISFRLKQSPKEPSFLIGYVQQNKTYLYRSSHETIELFNNQQLNKLAQLTATMTLDQVEQIFQTLTDDQQLVMIEVQKDIWQEPNRPFFISDCTLLHTWYPKLNTIGRIPLRLPESEKVNFWGKGQTNSFILGYFDKNQVKPVYYSKQQSVEHLLASEPQSLTELSQVIDLINTFSNRRYFLLEVPPNYKAITEQTINKLYPGFNAYLNELKQRHGKQMTPTKDAPVNLSSTMLRYARHVESSQQLEIVSPSDYKTIKNFRPFLTNHQGDVLAIPCSAQVGRLKTQFSIFGWYINDNGFVKLRWFPHHKDAVNKRSSTIFIDIRSKQLFFSGSILNSETQDPVFLESLQFLDGRLGQHEQAFQNSFSSFMTSIHHMKKMGRLKSKDSSPNYTYRRPRY